MGVDANGVHFIGGQSGRKLRASSVAGYVTHPYGHVDDNLPWDREGAKGYAQPPLTAVQRFGLEEVATELGHQHLRSKGQLAPWWIRSSTGAGGLIRAQRRCLQHKRDEENDTEGDVLM